MTQSIAAKARWKIRLLPIVIVGVALLLAVRLGELSFGVELLPASPALAAEDKAEDAHKGTSKNDVVGVKLDVSRGLPDRGQA